MIKILHITHTDIKYDSRILKEMEALANASDSWIVNGIGVRMDEGNAKSAYSEKLTIYSIHLWSRKLRFLPNFLRHSASLVELTIKIFFKAIKIKPHVIHSHDIVALPVSLFIKMLFRSKVIYDAHELESDRNGLSRSLSKATYLTEKALWPFVNYFITVSPSIDKWYNENFGEKPSGIILNSPVYDSNVKEHLVYNTNYLHREFKIPQKRKIFIYVGILGKGRGIETFLEVFKKNDKADIVFMGFGALKGSILNYSESYSNIHYHQAVPHDNVVDIIRSADVGICMIENVSLSDYYSLPNKLFEYSFSGVPVIASNFPDISEFVQKNNLGVCCEQNLESVEAAVNSFLSSKRISKYSTKQLEQYRWKAQEENLIKIYNGLL